MNHTNFTSTFNHTTIQSIAVQISVVSIITIGLAIIMALLLLILVVRVLVHSKQLSNQKCVISTVIVCCILIGLLEFGVFGSTILKSVVNVVTSGDTSVAIISDFVFRYIIQNIFTLWSGHLVLSTSMFIACQYAFTALKILFAEAYTVKLLKSSLIINYVIQYIPFLTLQCVTLLLFGLHFIVPQLHLVSIDVALVVITLLQFVLLLLYTLINMVFIIGMTGGLIHLLYKHYHNAQLSQENDPLCKSKSKNMKLALCNVIFFMISITMTLLWKCIIYCVFVLSIALETVYETQSKIIYILACAGFIIVVFAMLIVAIVLYSPRNFKSLRQLAQQVMKQLEKMPANAEEKKKGMESVTTVESTPQE